MGTHTKKHQYSLDNGAQGLFSLTGCSNSEHKMATETHTEIQLIRKEKTVVEILSRGKKNNNKKPSFLFPKQQ